MILYQLIFCEPVLAFFFTSFHIVGTHHRLIESVKVWRPGGISITSEFPCVFWDVTGAGEISLTITLPLPGHDSSEET